MSLFSKLKKLFGGRSKHRYITRWSDGSGNHSLTKDAIDQADDSRLVHVVIDNLALIVNPHYTLTHEEEAKSVERMSKGQQVIWVTYSVECLVKDGGFNSFYYCSSGQSKEMAVESFKLIGAIKHAELMQRANDIYAREKAKITEKQDGTLEGFIESNKDNPLNDLSPEYFSLDESLHQLQVDFIRANQEQFIGQ